MLQTVRVDCYTAHLRSDINTVHRVTYSQQLYGHKYYSTCDMVNGWEKKQRLYIQYSSDRGKNNKINDIITASAPSINNIYYIAADHGILIKTPIYHVDYFGFRQMCSLARVTHAEK